MKEFAGKVALVTGAASGIGLALARAAGQRGMKVVLVDIEADPLEAAAAGLRAEGVEVMAQLTDVANESAMDALARQVHERFGAVHVLFNNAGVGGGGCLWELDTAYWQWVLGVNLWGVIHGIRLFVKPMIEQGEGYIVNTASVAGLMSAPGSGPYNVSKHAVVTLSETLYGELRNAGARVGVSVLCPSFVNTKIYAADRNRPDREARMQDPAYAEEQKIIAELASGFFETAMSADSVADLVFGAMERGDFYILPHQGIKEQVSKRMAAILDNGVPDVRGPEDFPLA